VIDKRAQATLHQQLLAGAGRLGITLSEVQVEQLLAYLRLLARWNSAYNLSAVRTVDDMLSRHLLDSLSIVPFLLDGDSGGKGFTGGQLKTDEFTTGQRWLDVGSGGGLPGIPLAILFPGNEIRLLDSNGKKTRFLFQVKTELQLTAVSVVQSRIEAFRPERHFNGVFSRAFASLGEFLSGCAHLVTPGGYCYAMKGRYPEDELRAVQKPFTVEHCHPLQVPGDVTARHLVVIKRENN
jgi:16S rRNA (guanine527-N7)-methyltransferase